MITSISILLFSIFSFLSGIHFYWAFGGKWGTKVVYPILNEQNEATMPGIVPTLTVAFGLLFFAVFTLLHADFFELMIPNWLDKTGLFMLTVIFLLRTIGDFKYIGFFKKIKDTKFAINDTKYYSPLCLLISLLNLFLAVNN